MAVVPLVRKGFYLGSYPSFDPSAVPEGGVWRGRNVRISESGLLKIRPGSVPVGGPGGKTSIDAAISAFGDILLIHDGSLHRMGTDGNLTLLEDSIETEGTPQMVRWTRASKEEPEGKEMVYIFTGKGIWETDGTPEGTQLVVPTVPSAKENRPKNLLLKEGTENDPEQDLESGPAQATIVLLRVSDGQRLVAAKDNTLWFSDPLDPGYWPVIQRVPLPQDGGRIVALSVWYGALIIFRDRDIWAYFRSDETDLANRALVLQDRAVGCSAPGSVAHIPGAGIVFLGGPMGKTDNVFLLSQVQAIEGQVQAAPIGDPIHRQLIDAVNRYGIDGVCSVYYQGVYRLSMPSNLGNDRVFVLTLTQTGQGWVTDTGPRNNLYVIHEGELYATKYNLGEVIKLTEDSLTDEGHTIPVTIAFRREDLQPGPTAIKRLHVFATMRGRTVEDTLYWYGGVLGETVIGETFSTAATVVTGTPQHLEVEILVEGEHISVKTIPVRIEQVEADLGYEAVYIYEARFRPSLKAHFAQVQIKATRPGEEIAILGYGLDVVPRRRTRGHYERGDN